MSATFDDGKDAGALRTIGEVSAALGIKAHVLRYWEQQFSALQPLKRSGGRRYYRPGDVALVESIDRLVNREGYTLKGAQQALKDKKTGEAGTMRETSPAPVGLNPAHAPLAGAAVPADVLGQLRAIRNTLARALEG